MVKWSFVYILGIRQKTFKSNLVLVVILVLESKVLWSNILAAQVIISRSRKTGLYCSFFSLKVRVAMRFPARGAWNAKFHPSYKNIGWTYVQTTLSEPEFLECIDKQIFVPMMLRYNANCYRAGNFFLTARALIGYFDVTWHQTNETVSPERAHSKICRRRETVHCYPRLLTGGAIHSTKISGNFGPKLSGSVRSNQKSFEKTGLPFEANHFSRSDRPEFWLHG